MKKRTLFLSITAAGIAGAPAFGWITKWRISSRRRKFVSAPRRKLLNSDRRDFKTALASRDATAARRRNAAIGWGSFTRFESTSNERMKRPIKDAIRYIFVTVASLRKSR